MTIAQINDAVMSSAAEGEMGALFINAKEAVHMQRILHEMGHPQPRTHIQTDNLTVEGVINSRVRPKHTKLTATATCSHYRIFDKILNNLLFVD